jgi:integrase
VYPEKRVTVRGRTKGELAARLHRLASLREDRKLGLITPDELATKLRGLEDKRVTLAYAAHSYASLTRLAPATRRVVTSMFVEKGAMRFGRPTRGMLADLGRLRLEELDPPRVAKHFRSLADRLTWGATMKAWQVLGSVIRHAAEEGWIVQRPWGLWRPPAPTHKRRKARRECARNVDERARLLHAMREIEDGRLPAGRRLELVAAVAMGLHTGARKGELAGLKWRDLEWLEGGVRVSLLRQYDGQPLKQGERRTVDAGAELVDALAPLRPYAKPNQPVFPSSAGGHLTCGEVVDVTHLRAAAARAGLGDPSLWSLHSLRDSYVTIEAQACGGDLRRLAERTGHRSIDSLLRYLQTFDRTPRAAPATGPGAPRLPEAR